jgi:chromosome segregation ATPase
MSEKAAPSPVSDFVEDRLRYKMKTLRAVLAEKESRIMGLENATDVLAARVATAEAKLAKAEEDFRAFRETAAELEQASASYFRRMNAAEAALKEAGK